jgi:hypothetical protein
MSGGKSEGAGAFRLLNLARHFPGFGHGASIAGEKRPIYQLLIVPNSPE